MKRSDFIKTTLGLLAIPAVVKAIPEEGKPVFNVKKLQERIDHLSLFPKQEIIIPHAIEKIGDGDYYLYVPFETRAPLASCLLDDRENVFCLVSRQNMISTSDTILRIRRVNMNAPKGVSSRRRHGKKIQFVIGSEFTVYTNAMQEGNA